MFSDHDNLSNEAAAVGEPEAAPEGAHPETNSTLESEAEPAVPAPGKEHAEAPSAGQETPLRATPEHTGASTDSATAHAAAEANREAHAADAESATADEEAAGSEEMSKLLEQYDTKQEAAASHEGSG